MMPNTRQSYPGGRAIQQCATLRVHPLLQRNPALLSIFLICGALLLVVASFNAQSIFPAFALLGASPTLPCLLLAFVLGTCGATTSIVTILACVDRKYVPAHIQPETKEHRYDRH